ncbi:MULTISPECIES: hypothetical protein [Paracoccus]|jgi:hypothetical protein|uniref:hypothetical protein n=1 Tax=Paracoccus TaxID=265 RepID=UPI0025858926|nr:hypothetical protein [Paracoccus sp. (in: a-proteobacteria)]
MRPFPCLLVLVLILAASVALADCRTETLISCDIGDGRHLEICIEPGDFQGEGAFTYAFGPKGRPELTLRETFAAGTASPWSGVGRAIWESVAFRNDGHVYEAWHSVDRLDEDMPLEAGVTILRGEAFLAALSCKSGPATVIAPLFTIQDAMAAAGFCRDLNRHEWRRGSCG